MTTSNHFDVVIIGGGLAGISLALALSQLSPAPRVALIESHDYQKLAPPGFDSRTVALSYSSRQIFSGLGVWQAMCDSGLAPIHSIHISDRGHMGVTRLSAQEQGVDALGYVIENRVLGQTLLAALTNAGGVTALAPATVSGLSLQTDHYRVVFKDNTPAAITASLVVAADGSQSFVRDYLQVKAWEAKYGQQAVIANLAMDRSHNNIAYERFSATGPMALLPLPPYGDIPHRYGLVWTVPDAQADTVMQWNDATFISELHTQLGDRAGTILQAGKRSAYPLSMMQIREHIRPRLAFIGNAAHTLHPVAGQGFNLGLRDVAALAQIIRDARTRHADIGSLTELEKYAQWRKRDQWQTMLFTDGLVRMFSTDFLPVVLVRQVGLMTMELLTPLRRQIARQAMGFIGKSSLLARGLGL